jgi:hypothetical protein
MILVCLRAASRVTRHSRMSRVVRTLLACTVRVRCHRPFLACLVLCSTRTACSIRTTFARAVHVSSFARVAIRAL